MNKRIRECTLKACARAVAATDGDVLVHLVVTFLRRSPRCIMAARVGALLPIKEIGPDGRSSIGLPLLLTNGGVSSTCIQQGSKILMESENEMIETSVRKYLQCYRGLCIEGRSCHGM